jgi:HD-GYP domain-containing protein (c-di-GMP phosphodiesterase class II)
MTHGQEVKIRVFDLEIGMYVSRLDKEWVEASFPLQGFVIESDSQIQTLADQCEYVYVTVSGGRFSSGTTSMPPTHRSAYRRTHLVKKSPKLLKKQQALKAVPAPIVQKEPLFKRIALQLKKACVFCKEKGIETFSRNQTYHLNDIVTHKIVSTKIKPPQKQVSVKQEIDSAKQAHDQANVLLKKFMDAVKVGETINMVDAEQAVHGCILSALRSPDALLLVSHLYKKHPTIWEHSMRVSVLAMNLGRYLNLNDEELKIIGLCGMLHDVGALFISKEMLEESDNKLELMQSHTILGRDILLNCTGEFNEIIAEVAYSHHEYMNGGGYPRGLKYEQILSYSRIISIIDLYVALTTEGYCDKVLTHYEAILVLLEHSNTHLDEVLVHSFIRCLGAYPVGCFVEMNTGEVGIVVEENPDEKLKPKVMLITTHDKKPCFDHLIDLADLKGVEILYEITSVVHPDKYAASTKFPDAATPLSRASAA